MLLPTSRHRYWNVLVDPVKWMPARSGSARATFDSAIPSPVSRLITPDGRPASSSRRIRKYAENVCVGDGFQITVLPISAGAVGRLPAIAVKLNGVMA